MIDFILQSIAARIRLIYVRILQETAIVFIKYFYFKILKKQYYLLLLRIEIFRKVK